MYLLNFLYNFRKINKNEKEAGEYECYSTETNTEIVNIFTASQSSFASARAQMSTAPTAMDQI